MPFWAGVHLHWPAGPLWPLLHNAFLFKTLLLFSQRSYSCKLFQHICKTLCYSCERICIYCELTIDSCDKSANQWQQSQSLNNIVGKRLEWVSLIWLQKSLFLQERLTLKARKACSDWKSTPCWFCLIDFCCIFQISIILTLLIDGAWPF